MSSAIQNILEHSLGDGARPSKFDVQVLMPTSKLFPDEVALSVLAKTASFPGKQHEIISLKHKGRTIPMKGQMRYVHSIDITFYLTEDHALKIAFEQWMEALDQKHNYDNPHVMNVSELQKYFASADTNYTMPIVLTQKNFDLDKDRVVYTLQNAFPTAVTPIEVNSETTGTISEFTVTFAYSHFLVNAVHYDKTNAEQWTDDVENILRGAVQTAEGFFGGITNSVSAQITNTINNTINRVTSEITGTVSSAVTNMAQSFTDSLF